MEDTEESGRRLSGMTDEILHGEQMEVLPVAGTEYVLLRSRLHPARAFLVKDKEGTDATWRIVFNRRDSECTDEFGIVCACCLRWPEDSTRVIDTALASQIRVLYLRHAEVWWRHPLPQTKTLDAIEAKNFLLVDREDLYPFIAFSESTLGS